MDPYYKELFKEIQEKKPTKDSYTKLKIRLCKKHNLKKIPTDIEVSLKAPESIRKKFKYLLSIKPARENSGVNVVAIMTKPYKCPHGRCNICPGGPESEFGDVPQSYTGKEPATRRAIRNLYDPYLQVWNRLEQYIAMNKIPSKVELIIMGGTFPSVPKEYQTNFIKYSFKAMNDFSEMFFSNDKLNLALFKEFFELPGDINNKERETRVKEKILNLKKTCSLESEQSKNEKSNIRCVGLTIETRPDYAMLEHANFMLKLGCTRVELGVQSIDDKILKKINRGHSVNDSIKATEILKDLGFKINYHIMPGLPGSKPADEINNFIELFSSQEFQPDMLKIYPCMVMKGTKLYENWKKGNFIPLDTKSAASLICEFKKIVPKYVRIMRVQRDIPTMMTQAGVDRTNLRQYIDKECKEKKICCKCIRCREIKSEKFDIKKVDTHISHYLASNGNEFFIESTFNDKLIGFCRMRFPHNSLRKEITDETALIRELHVYGDSITIGKTGKVQHKGIGKTLLQLAEKEAKIYYKKKMVIISAVGTRDYYRKFGYKKEGPYMVKMI